jgi:preprotein translocase subunit YajC
LEASAYNGGLPHWGYFFHIVVFYGVCPVLISSAFAQTAPAAAGGGDSALLSMLPLVLMFVVLYFLMIRPQMKRQKEQRAMIDALQKGDEIVTIGGVLGKISSISDTYMTLDVSQGQMQIERAAVARVLPKGTIK